GVFVLLLNMGTLTLSTLAFSDPGVKEKRELSDARTLYSSAQISFPSSVYLKPTKIIRIRPILKSRQRSRPWCPQMRWRRPWYKRTRFHGNASDRRYPPAPPSSHRRLAGPSQWRAAAPYLVRAHRP